MAKQRIVNTKFWDDSYIVRLSPTAKLVFLYLLTNPLTNISGVYELPLRRAAFDVGIPEEGVKEIVDKFVADGKVIYSDGWVAVVNFIKYQILKNQTVRQGIVVELRKVPRKLLDQLPLQPDLLNELNLRPQQWSERKVEHDAPRGQGVRSLRELLPTVEAIKARC